MHACSDPGCSAVNNHKTGKRTKMNPWVAEPNTGLEVSQVCSKRGRRGGISLEPMEKTILRYLEGGYLFSLSWIIFLQTTPIA